MALEAANCLMVLVVFTSCVAFQVFCRLFDRLTKKGMALTSTRTSGERCVLMSAYGANGVGAWACRKQTLSRPQPPTVLQHPKG